MQGLDLGLNVLLPEEAEQTTDEVSTRESEIIALQYKYVMEQTNKNILLLKMLRQSEKLYPNTG